MRHLIIIMQYRERLLFALEAIKLSDLKATKPPFIATCRFITMLKEIWRILTDFYTIRS